MYESLCCAICREPIPARRALSAKYCGQKCKNKALTLERHSERLRRKLDADRIIQAHELWFAVFHRELMRAAPPEAGGYQLGLWTGQSTHWFPSLRKGQKYRHTLRGRRTEHAFFALTPFEPPTVPIAAWYEVRYVQKVPPHPPLPSVIKTWRKKVPYAVPCGPLPFNLRTVPHDAR
ncbi:MAG: hypothetical protein JNJ46_20065 [Myxococcales bacterium]|nr:hypothetical protein [Myxococcales bacterium]